MIEPSAPTLPSKLRACLFGHVWTEAVRRRLNHSQFSMLLLLQAVAAADLVESAPPSLPPTGPKSLRFLAVGDWGKDNVGEYADADGMETIASKIGANFTVMLGDNFYTTGIHGDAHSPRFE